MDIKIDSYISQEEVDRVAINRMQGNPEVINLLTSAAINNNIERLQVIKYHIELLSEKDAIILNEELERLIKNRKFDE